MSKIEFKCKIKAGTKFAQDASWGNIWPTDAGWRLDPQPDVNTVFAGEFVAGRDFVDLRAHGFGNLKAKDGYGNGSLFVWDLTGLDMDDVTRRQIYNAKRKFLEKVRAMAAEEVAKIDARIFELR